MFRIVTAFLLALACTTTAAPLYKWVDENGVTHFSERPPLKQSGVQAINVNGVPAISGQDERNQNINDVPIADTESNETPPADLENTQNQAPEKNPELCEQALMHLGRIRDNSRIRARDPATGDLTYLNAEQIAQQEKSWQTQADTYCE